MTWPAAAQESIYTGTLDDTRTAFTLQIELTAGESLSVFALATSGTLDTLLTLIDSTGRVVISNDDRTVVDLNSAIGYTSAQGGSYTLSLSRASWRPTAGDYRLTITIGDRSVLSALATDASTIRLSGPTETRETDHFRILYTRSGEDGVDGAYLQIVESTLEWVWEQQVGRLGWPAPILPMASRIDVYLMDLIDEDSDFGSILGINHGDFATGDNPNTPDVIEAGSASTIRLDNDYAEYADEDHPLVWLRSTAAHEFHHSIQRGYDALEPMRWYMEATAEWIATLVVPEDDAAFERVEDNYRYAHICFGAFDLESMGLMYGDWPFLAMLGLHYGKETPYRLWENIARYDGFEALERLAESLGTTLADMLAEYRLRNLLRDYPFAERFGRVSVWSSDTLERRGRLSGYGMQELAANYITVDLPAGVYEVSVDPDGGRLGLWAVGIRDAVASIFRLGDSGVIDTRAHDELYLMVFNPDYDDNLSECSYATYTLHTQSVNGAVDLPVPDETRAVPFFRSPS
jgi:hypothetical protein